MRYIPLYEFLIGVFFVYMLPYLNQNVFFPVFFYENQSSILCNNHIWEKKKQLIQTRCVHVAYLRFSGSKVTTSFDFFFIAGFPRVFLPTFFLEAGAILKVNLTLPFHHYQQKIHFVLNLWSHSTPWLRELLKRYINLVPEYQDTVLLISSVFTSLLVDIPE